MVARTTNTLKLGRYNSRWYYGLMRLKFSNLLQSKLIENEIIQYQWGCEQGSLGEFLYSQV